MTTKFMLMSFYVSNDNFSNDFSNDLPNSYIWINESFQFLEWDLPEVSFEILEQEISNLYFHTNNGELFSLDYIIVLKKLAREKDVPYMIILLKELSKEIYDISELIEEEYLNRDVPDWLQELLDEIRVQENKYRDDQPDLKTLINLENQGIIYQNEFAEKFPIDKEIFAEGEDYLPPIISKNRAQKEEPFYEGDNQPGDKGDKKPDSEKPVHEDPNQPVHEDPNQADSEKSVHGEPNQPGQKPVHESPKEPNQPDYDDFPNYDDFQDFEEYYDSGYESDDEYDPYDQYEPDDKFFDSDPDKVSPREKPLIIFPNQGNDCNKYHVVRYSSPDNDKNNADQSKIDPKQFEDGQNNTDQPDNIKNNADQSKIDPKQFEGGQYSSDQPDNIKNNADEIDDYNSVTDHSESGQNRQNYSQNNEQQVPLANQGDECDKHHVIFDEYYLIKYVRKEKVKLVAAYKIFKYGDDIIGSYIIGGINSLVEASEEKRFHKYFFGINTIPNMSPESRKGIEYLFEGQYKPVSERGTKTKLDTVTPFSKIRVLGIVSRRNTSSFIVENTRSFFNLRRLRFVAKFMRQIWLNEDMSFHGIIPPTFLKPIILDIKSAFVQPLMAMIKLASFHKIRSWLYFKISVLRTWLYLFINPEDAYDCIDKVERTEVFRRKTHGFQSFIEVLNIFVHKDHIAMRLRAFNFKSVTLAVLQVIFFSCAVISLYRCHSQNTTFVPLANVIWLKKKASIESFYKYQHRYSDLHSNRDFDRKPNHIQFKKLLTLVKAYNQKENSSYKNLLCKNIENIVLIDSMIFNQFKIAEGLPIFPDRIKNIFFIIAEKIMQIIFNLLESDYFNINILPLWMPLITLILKSILIWPDLLGKYLANIHKLSSSLDSEIQLTDFNRADIIKSKSYYLYNYMLFKEHLNMHHPIDVVSIPNQVNNNLHRSIDYLDSIFNLQTKEYEFSLLQKNTQEFRKLMDLLYTYFFDYIIYNKNSRFLSIENTNQDIIFYIENYILINILDMRNKNFININSLENISFEDKQDFFLNQYSNIIPQFTKNYKNTINSIQSDFYKYSNLLNEVDLWKSMTILLKSNKLSHLLDDKLMTTPQLEYSLKRKYQKLNMSSLEEIQYRDFTIPGLTEYTSFLSLEWWDMVITNFPFKNFVMYLSVKLYHEYLSFGERIIHDINFIILNFKRLMHELIKFIKPIYNQIYNQIIASERFQYIFYKYEIIPEIFYWLSYSFELFHKYLFITLDYVYLIIKISFFRLESLAMEWYRIRAYMFKHSEKLNLKIQSCDGFSSLSTVFNSLNTHSRATGIWTTVFGIGSLIISRFLTVGGGLFAFILWQKFHRVRYLLLPNSYTELNLLVFLRYRRNREKFVGRKINDEEDDLLQHIYSKSLVNSYTAFQIKLANRFGRKSLTSWFVDTGTADVFYDARKLACQLLINEPEIAKINLSSLELSFYITAGPYITTTHRKGLNYLNKLVRSTFSSYLKKTNFPVKLLTLLASEREWLPASYRYLSLILDPVPTTPLSRGLLLIGPPDTGKHFLAKSIAADVNFPLVYFSIEDLLTIFEFENEEINSESSAYFLRENIVKIKAILNFYKFVFPCVVWIPKVESINDSYVSSRVRQVAMRIVSTNLLRDMRQARIKHKDTIFIGSCEDTSYLDPQFICEGRLDRILYVRRPTNSRRPQIFARLIKIKGFKLPDELDWYPTFANNSMGYSMRELAHFANRVCQDYILYDDKKNSFNLADLKKLIIKEMRAISGGGKYDIIFSRYKLQYKIGRVLVQILFVKPQPTVSLFARMDVWANELHTLSRVFLEPGISDSAVNPFTILNYILSYVAGFAARAAWLIVNPEMIHFRELGGEADEDIFLAGHLLAGIFKYYAHSELIQTNSLVPKFRYLYGPHTIQETFLPVSRPPLSEDDKIEIGIEVVDPPMTPPLGYQPKLLLLPTWIEEQYLAKPAVPLISLSIKNYRIAMSRTIHFEFMKKIDEPLAPLTSERYYGKLCINSFIEEKHRAEPYLYHFQLDRGKYSTVAYNLDYEHYLMFLKQRIKDMKLKKKQLSILDPEYNPLVNDVVILEGRSIWNPSAFEPSNVFFRKKGLYVNEALMCVYHSRYTAQKGYSMYENPFLMHRKTLRRRVWHPDEYYERIAIEKIRELQEEAGVEESNLMVYSQNEPEEGETKVHQMKGTKKKDKKRKGRAPKLIGKRKEKKLLFYKYQHLVYANSIFRRPRIYIERKYDAPSKRKIDQSRFSGISILQDHFAQYRSFNRPKYLQERLVNNCIFECYTYLLKFFINHQELLINLTDALIGEIRLTEDQIISIVLQYGHRKNLR